MQFDRFVDFYNGAAQDRRDGYTAAMFADLSTSELQDVRRMLLDRALTGDTIDLRGLVHVGDADTIEALRTAEELDSVLGYRFAVGRLATLHKLTGDPTHLTGLFRWIDSRAADGRDFAAQELSSNTLPAMFIAPLVDRLISGKHEDIVIPLTTSWLAAQGEPTTDMARFQHALVFIRSVVAERPSRRLELLMRWTRPAQDGSKPLKL